MSIYGFRIVVERVGARELDAMHAFGMSGHIIRNACEHTGAREKGLQPRRKNEHRRIVKSSGKRNARTRAR